MSLFFEEASGLSATNKAPNSKPAVNPGRYRFRWKQRIRTAKRAPTCLIPGFRSCTQLCTSCLPSTTPSMNTTSTASMVRLLLTLLTYPLPTAALLTTYFPCKMLRLTFFLLYLNFRHRIRFSAKKVHPNSKPSPLLIQLK